MPEGGCRSVEVASARRSPSTSGPGVNAPGPVTARFPRCAAAGTLEEACDGIADDLLALGCELPSVYLLAGKRLRCHASRGYFHVVDGFSPGVGVLGTVVATGVPAVVDDVACRPDFIFAIPGLVAEVCVPVRCGGEVIGAINVESFSPFAPAVVGIVAEACVALGRRLDALGGLPAPVLAQRLAQISIELTQATDGRDIEDLAVAAAVEISGVSSAAVAHIDGEHAFVSAARGSLADALLNWRRPELEVLASWVHHDTSSHHPGGAKAPVGYGFLKRAGVESISVHPMTSGGTRMGLLVVAGMVAGAHALAVVDSLELLAAQTAASLKMASLLREASRRADRDALTGLGNRSHFETSLSALLAAGGCPAVLLLDLDDFKQINDSLGHVAGDRLLVAVGQRIEGVLRGKDVACRLGGDEFVVVLADASEEEAVEVAERLLTALARSLTVEHTALEISASVGVARIEDDPTVEGLLQAADLAMYRAKERGKGYWAAFEPWMYQAATDRMALEVDLREALRSDGLTIEYQPIVDLGTGAMVGVEALARWQHPVRGRVDPAEFIALAEANGLIVPLGAWVLEKAGRQLLAWDELDGPPLDLAVNLSGRQLGRVGIVATVDACLALGVDPRRLILEVTETALSTDEEEASQDLRAIRRRGVRVAADDFGSGYSSLRRLRSTPVDVVKLDRSFMDDIVARDAEVSFVDAVLTLAGGLQLDVVAEGVETEVQLRYLQGIGCPKAQGYLLARPCPPDRIAEMIGGDVPWAALFAPSVVASSA